MNNTIKITENISKEILTYIEEDLATAISPFTYVPSAKKGFKSLEKWGKKILGDKFYSLVGEPEVGGFQKPGVLPAIAAMLAPQLHRAALDKGAFMGASQGAIGGAIGGGALGAFAGSSTVPLGGGTGKGKAARALWQLIKRLGATGLGGSLGAGIGTLTGAAAGALRGRAAGSAILGGGIGAAGPALLGAAVPALGLGALGASGLLAGLGGAFGSDIMKNIWRARGKLAKGGATDTYFSSSPISRRVGGS